MKTEPKVSYETFMKGIKNNIPEYMEKERLRRDKLKSKRQKYLFFVLIVLIIVFLSSCTGTHFVTQYRITTAERSYYCNHPQFVNDTVRGAELKRNGDIMRVFEIPYSKVISVDYNGDKYEWK